MQVTRVLAAREHIAEAAAELREAVTAAREAVTAAREAGDSWTVIAAALDTTRQVAQQRFATN